MDEVITNTPARSRNQLAPPFNATVEHVNPYLLVCNTLKPADVKL